MISCCSYKENPQCLRQRRERARPPAMFAPRRKRAKPRRVCARRRKENRMIFFGDMRVEKNSYRGAECRPAREADRRGAERSAFPSNESPAQRVSFEKNNSVKNSRSYFWSWQCDSNTRPADYESAALPTELCQQLLSFIDSLIIVPRRSALVNKNRQDFLPPPLEIFRGFCYK